MVMRQVIARISKSVLCFFQSSVTACQRSPLDFLPRTGQANEDGVVRFKSAQHLVCMLLRRNHAIKDDMVPRAQQDIRARVSAADELNVDRRPVVLLIGTVEYGLREAIQNGVDGKVQPHIRQQRLLQSFAERRFPCARAAGDDDQVGSAVFQFSAGLSTRSIVYRSVVNF